MPQLFDETELLERVGHDWEFLRQIVEMLSTEGRSMVQDLHRAAASSDAASIRSTAHTLKGMISNFCAHDAFTTAAVVEQLGKAGDVQFAPKAISELEVRLEQLITALNDWLAPKP